MPARRSVLGGQKVNYSDPYRSSSADFLFGDTVQIEFTLTPIALRVSACERSAGLVAVLPAPTFGAVNSVHSGPFDFWCFFD